MWHYAIHGKNAEIIQILEENHVKLPKNETYKHIFIESIKCHHNDVADYIQNYYPTNEIGYPDYVLVNGLKYQNFKFIKKEQIDITIFNLLCEYDYYTLVSILLNTMGTYINHKTIYKKKKF